MSFAKTRTILFFLFYFILQSKLCAAFKDKGCMSTKDLMRELDEKEEAIKSVQDKAERLMFKNHPARLTIEVSPAFCSAVRMRVSV